MDATHPAIAALNREITELDRRRAELVDAVRRLESVYREKEAPRNVIIGAGGVGRALATHLFFPQPLGPTEALRQVIGGEPGIARTAAIDMALPLVSKDAADPKRSLQQTLRTLIHRAAVTERDGGLYLP